MRVSIAHSELSIGDRKPASAPARFLANQIPSNQVVPAQPAGSSTLFLLHNKLCLPDLTLATMEVWKTMHGIGGL